MTEVDVWKYIKIRRKTFLFICPKCKTEIDDNQFELGRLFIKACEKHLKECKE